MTELPDGTSSPESEHFKVLGITVHVQCECGQLLDIRKQAKR